MRKEIGDTTKKKISIGVEDFKEIIDKDGYFVDKTLMIKELIESNAKVTLFTRPRRFGKTLNQFMIRRFFEDEITEKAKKSITAISLTGWRSQSAAKKSSNTGSSIRSSL